MNRIVKIILSIVVAVLLYLVYDSIAGPIREMAEVERREKITIASLEKIRDAELAYKELKGTFTKDWDELIATMKTGKFKLLIKEGDPDDSTSVLRTDSVFVSIKDSLFKNFNLDSIAFVPFGEGIKFELDAGTVTQNNVTVHVFEAKDPKPYGQRRREEKNPLKVGSMGEATYSGNW